MRKLLYISILSILSLSTFAQKQLIPKNRKFDNNSFGKTKKIEFMKGRDIICPANFEDAHTYVPPATSKELAAKARTKSKTTVIVTYHGFDNYAQAKGAFQAAIDIWAGIIDTPVPIHVDATFQSLEPNTLGSARAGDFTRNFPGQQKDNVWYPIALAEKIAGQDLNSSSEPDIVAHFNSDFTWSYGSGASGKYDFESVVLHELCHGLGFTGSWSVDNGKGSWGYGTGSPFIYDTFLYSGADLQLVDTLNYSNNSTVMKTQCTSNNVFFNGLVTNSQNSKRPKIYAPSSWQDGSSMSHLDDGTYPAGNENSLMTSRVSASELIRDPGPIVKTIFADMGWTGTSIVHDPIKSSEQSLSKVDVSVKITTDNTLTPNSYKLFYTENDTLMSNAKSVVLSNDGKSDNYTATIPITKSPSVIRYYFTVSDATKRTYTAPAEAPTKGYYGFGVGYTDTTPPYIASSVPNFVSANSSPDLIVLAEDNFQAGIDTVYVEYTLNGTAKPAIGLHKYNKAVDGADYSIGEFDSYLYLTKAPFGKLNNGDRVKYRFIAIDKAKAKNKATLPAYFDTPTNVNGITSDYFETVATSLVSTTPVNSYSNNFNTTTKDFATIGFNIEQPSGFDNPALHTIHPYKNGGDANLQSNLLALLLQPIKISAKTDSSVIRFDEVVLVEPGEDGAVYGDNAFYDYVVVEGSYDGGATWEAFADGYDSNNNAAWLSKFASSLVQSTISYNGSTIRTQDSKAVGSSTLFKSREIQMISDNANFAAGDVVLIRFRLFSDELTYGWGWAIDNLQIQTPKVIITAVEPTHNAVEVYPNPSTEELSLRIEVPQNARKATLSFLNTQGNRLIEQDYEVTGGLFSKTIDISSMPDGMYFVKLKTENSEVIRKFVVKH